MADRTSDTPNQPGIVRAGDARGGGLVLEANRLFIGGGDARAPTCNLQQLLRLSAKLGIRIEIGGSFAQGAGFDPAGLDSGNQEEKGGNDTAPVPTVAIQPPAVQPGSVEPAAVEHAVLEPVVAQSPAEQPTPVKADRRDRSHRAIRISGKLEGSYKRTR